MHSRPRWTPAYVALGANLGDARRQVETAFQQLADLPRTRLVARSRLYRSPPLQLEGRPPLDQPDFINAAAGLLTLLDAPALLEGLKAIEKNLGREPSPVRWGPRPIDLDLVVYGSRVSTEVSLQLPHPGIHERNFVLYPLAEIAPRLWVPGRGIVAELAHRLGQDGLAPAD